MNEKLSTILSKLRQAFSELYGDRLSKLILFGSQARGDAEFGSDIDILVVLKSPVDPVQEIKKTIDVVARLSLEYDEVLSCVFMDETRFHTEESPLLLNVRQEGFPV